MHTSVTIEDSLMHDGNLVFLRIQSVLNQMRGMRMYLLGFSGLYVAAICSRYIKNCPKHLFLRFNGHF